MGTIREYVHAKTAPCFYMRKIERWRFLMKRISISIISIMLLTLFCVGCRKKEDPANGSKETEVTNKAAESTVQADTAKENDGISIISSIFPSYDFACQITGGVGELTMLLPPGSESHSYEPTPQDTIKIRNCDVFIYVGGESDSWIDQILDSMDISNMKIIKMMDCVETVPEELVDGMEEVEIKHESKEAEYDEHVWTSPKNAKIIVEKIAEVICQADPENALKYQLNTEEYLKQLDVLDQEFQEIVDQGVRKVLIFGDRFPFRYLTDEYGLDYYAAFPGCAAETEPSAQTVSFLIDKVKEEKIPVVFHIEMSNEKMADTICEETGAKKMLFHACHNVSRDDLKNGITYLELMENNVKALKEALQ